MLQSCMPRGGNYPRKIKHSIKANTFAYLLVSVFGIVYMIFLYFSYRKFMFPVLDLGLFNRHMWSLVHFDFGPNPLKGWNLLGDHAHFFLVLLAPLYWLYQSPVFLLFIQALAIVLSAWPIYLVAKHYLKNKTVAALWLVPYFTYFGFWSALAYPFHDSPVAVLPIAWALYFLLVTKNDKHLLMILAALLLVREDMPLVAIMIGLYLIIIDRKYKLGSLVVVVASLYFWWVTRYWLPFASRGVSYPYEDTVFGASMLDAIKAAFLQPKEFVKNIFLPIDKTKSIVFMLGSFGGLAIIGIEILLLLSPMWLGRFLSTQPWRWSVVQHYSASQAPILIVASILGLSRLSKFIAQSVKIKINKVIIVYIGLLLALMGTGLVYSRLREHYAGRLLRPTFYGLDQYEKSAHEAIQLVPEGASVGVQSAFPQLTSREKVYNAPLDVSKLKPDYIILSDKFDQWPFTGDQIYRFRDSAISDYGYRYKYNKNNVWLLEKSE